MMPAFARFIHAVSPLPGLWAVVLCVLMISLGEEVHMIPPAYAATTKSPVEPINLCDYSGPSFDEVNALLHDRVRPGDHVDKLRAAISATPVFRFAKRKTGKFLNFTSNFMDGTMEMKEPFFIEKDLKGGGHGVCIKGDNNEDHWWLATHTDSTHKIIEFQLLLLYIDEAFLARNEPLNTSRYMDTGFEGRHLEKAVNDIWQAQDPTASNLFAMMDTAGFTNINETGISKFRDGAKPILPAGAHLKIYRQVLGNDGTSFSQDSLFFRLGWWMFINSNYALFIIYNPETDEIISISADEPPAE